MSRTIAITGKGGTGKTTLAGLIVGGLIRAGATPVLAVDADPNMCLDEVLGVRATQSVGHVR
ncbi:MAG: carbon monoxide dehydrogenase, partial [Syntrophales bacterium]|nr:carbon monoxide dehydrogenase [Syntrophales bacterium]